MKKPYILQGQDTTCTFVAILNAIVHKKGTTPVEYNSEEYKELVKLGGGRYGPIISTRSIVSALPYDIQQFQPESPDIDVKEWLIDKLGRGFSVCYPVTVPKGYHHLILIISYNVLSESFTCVNAHFTEKVVEAIKWEDLKAASCDRWQKDHPNHPAIKSDQPFEGMFAVQVGDVQIPEPLLDSVRKYNIEFEEECERKGI